MNHHITSAVRVPLRHWVAVLGSMLGAFMAVLDIQITNASLKDILGSLGATMEEGSWVTTSYLVAEIVVIPLTGWLATVFSPRRYLLATTAAFLTASAACAWAWDLHSLIAFRVIQGFTGGAMIPMALTLVLRLLPERHHAAGFAVFGMTATFAPAIGPSIGGWLTENYGWPWIFYMNLVPGAFMLTALAWGMDKEPAQLSKLRHGDWAGIFTVATGLGCLITLLEEGNRNDWFNSPAMAGLAATAIVMLGAGLAIELRCRDPFIDLSLLGQRGFGISSAIGTVFGLGMYGVMYVLPVYLAQIQGYNAGQIGRTIMWSGVPQLLMMPVAALLAKRWDLRLLISLGLALFATSCLMNGYMTHWTAHEQLRTTQLIRALGMPLVIVPLTTLATRGLPAHRAGSASALFNMLRNLGGSVGIALLATRIDVAEKIHSVRLGESISLLDLATTERLRATTGYFVARGTDPVTAGIRALEVLDLTVRREAFVLAFGDAFTLLGVILLATIPFVWFVRPSRDR
ncbi:MAG: DHA2 family efflux MFS transporter permease subunit [Verrucomicrobia bacterium]|nr:DHA2 family efflux MFS transporter permease subunit [Verrucomicrobiota bacterium]